MYKSNAATATIKHTFSFLICFFWSLWPLVGWELGAWPRFLGFSSREGDCEGVEENEDNIIDDNGIPSSVLTFASENVVSFFDGEDHLPVSTLMKVPSPFLAELPSFETTLFPSTGLMGDSDSSSWLPSLSAEKRWSSALIFLEEVPGLILGCGW